MFLMPPDFDKGPASRVQQAGSSKLNPYMLYLKDEEGYMPTMYEIYEKHADRYDAMVQAEDYRGNLKKLLWEQVKWSGSSVLEAGVGTGRVTRIYAEQVSSAVCCDRSSHMLEFAAKNLADYGDRLTFKVAENREFPTFDSTFDVFIQGWSFGHSIMDCLSQEELESTITLLVNNSEKNIRPGGTVILIETLGTNADVPNAPTEKLGYFYEQLEHQHGYERYAVRTDLKYQSVEDAIFHLSFFFGDEMGEKLRKRGSAIIPEWTGVWIKQL